ncbi:MAG TPA: MFS transporter [Caldilineaceae bacterium]|nr:MFS transporter [Caldilineaceae bacterium]
MRSLLRNVTLWSLTLGHFSIDLLSGAMPIAVGLYLKEALGLSLAQVGLLLGLYSLSSSLTQPIFGYLSDRYGGRWFAVGGLLWMSVLQGLIGFMPNFASALTLATLAGFGSAAFHPQGASGANIAAGSRKTAGVAMFMLGGNFGFAIGPILAAVALGWMGVHGTALLGLIGLLIVPLLYILTGQATATASADKKPANWKIELNPAFSTTAVVALILVMSLRAFSQQSFSSFLPQFFFEVAKFTKAEASLLSSLMLFTLAFGTLTGGMPLMAAMFLLGDWRAFLIAPILGFFSGAAWPPMLVMAQSLFYKNAGVGSGVALGFVFAMGGLGLQVTGWLAEPQHLGLTNAMLILAFVPLVTAALVALLPSDEQRAVNTPLAQPVAAK